ncbi:DUF1800 domain-containing protein [Variovorax sp. JS1663]|uniref:DUF1800 domain-containing protein n=1 Tax=Variovorax sp. JS1663 TaxID=1851577 RepID=UPI000B3476AE|nr:DUF1800 domain-containing protein [Variovorax sp. JS1663]OUL98760.1 hypothetical protein A8M77_29905 [Variovorax sp. JS1663]
MNPDAIALNRFGLGARPDETPPRDPRRWLLVQFERYQPRPAPWSGQQGTGARLADYQERQRAIRSTPDEDKQAARQMLRRDARSGYLAAVDARLASALDTPAPFVERLVHFWANHFAISVEKPLVLGLAGSYEAEAIRPHVLGRFDALLAAAVRHPAMLVYLDQAQSMGPDSPAAQRLAERAPQRRRGLNENLAREILELHTLGVRSGYTQADVTEFARALTGWSVAGGEGPAPADPAMEAPEPGGFRFRPALHEPGARSVLGRRYAQPGEQQAGAILADLAAAPATARHIATKLARHFVADDPPPALVDRLAVAFQRSGGDLPSVYRVLVDAPESWTGTGRKFKTPWDWTVSSMRALGRRELKSTQAAALLAQLGQPVWRPGSPAGYDDIAASWAAPDALVRRVELAQRIASQAGDAIDPRQLAPRLLPGDALGEGTRLAIARADSASTGLALLLVSPDFLRR